MFFFRTTHLRHCLTKKMTWRDLTEILHSLFCPVELLSNHDVIFWVEWWSKWVLLKKYNLYHWAYELYVTGLVCKQKIFLHLDWLRSNTKLMSPKKTRDKRWKNPWSLGFPMKKWSYWSISIICCVITIAVFSSNNITTWLIWSIHISYV